MPFIRMPGLETTISISPNAEAAFRGLKPDALLASVGRGQVRATRRIVGQIQKSRLTGKGPFPPSEQKLGVKTGRLRGSLRASDSATITLDAVQTSIGSNVRYLRAHEFGFSGPVKVPAGRMKITQVFGRKLSAPLTAKRKAFTKHVTIPERKPIRAGIEENMPLIEREIIREVTKGARA